MLLSATNSMALRRVVNAVRGEANEPRGLAGGAAPRMKANVDRLRGDWPARGPPLPDGGSARRLKATHSVPECHGGGGLQHHIVNLQPLVRWRGADGAGID